MKIIPILMSLACMANVAAADNVAPFQITYKVTISQPGESKSYLMPSASDATQPAVISNIQERPVTKECRDGKDPVMDNLKIGDFIQLRPTAVSSKGELLTAYAYSVTRLKGIKVAQATPGGCVLDLPETATTEGTGVIRITKPGEVTVLSDNVDGLRVTVSIAN